MSSHPRNHLWRPSEAVAFRGVALLLVLLIPTQCGSLPNKDLGGDRNRWTGACKIEFEETLGDGTHQYPEFRPGGWVAGKVIMTCDQGPPPDTQNTTIHLEFWRDDAWRQVNRNTSQEVPAPKAAVYTQGTCRDGYWRVRVGISGTARQAEGAITRFQSEDASRRRPINCRGK